MAGEPTPPNIVTDSNVVFVKKDGAYLKLITITSDNKVTIQDAINRLKEEPDYPEGGADWSYTKGGPKANYSEDITGQTIQLYMIDVVQVSKKIQKIMNNGVEYLAGGKGIPTGGTNGQVLTRVVDSQGNKSAEWRNPTGGITSSTVTGLWAGSETQYSSATKKAGTIYFVRE